jgi:hypothetical protein
MTQIAMTSGVLAETNGFFASDISEIAFDGSVCALFDAGSRWALSYYLQAAESNPRFYLLFGGNRNSDSSFTSQCLMLERSSYLGHFQLQDHNENYRNYVQIISPTHLVLTYFHQVGNCLVEYFSSSLITKAKEGLAWLL